VRSRHALLLVLPALALGAAGCGVRREPAAGGAFPLTTTDSGGAVVRLTARPVRIACLVGYACRTLGALGVKATPATVGTLAALAPDLVVAPREADGTVVRGAAPHAVVYVFGGSDPAAAASAIAGLGLAVGEGARGIQIARTVGAGVTAALAAARRGQPRRVFVNPAELVADGPETPAGRLVTLAGGTNVVGRSAAIGFAALRADRAEVWLVGPGSATTLATLRASALTKAVPAVVAGRVATLDPADFEPSPDLPKALDALVALVRSP